MLNVVISNYLCLLRPTTPQELQHLWQKQPTVHSSQVYFSPHQAHETMAQLKKSESFLMNEDEEKVGWLDGRCVLCGIMSWVRLDSGREAPLIGLETDLLLFDLKICCLVYISLTLTLLCCECLNPTITTFNIGITEPDPVLQDHTMLQKRQP